MGVSQGNFNIRRVKTDKRFPEKKKKGTDLVCRCGCELFLVKGLYLQCAECNERYEDS